MSRPAVLLSNLCMSGVRPSVLHEALMFREYVKGESNIPHV